MTTGQAPPGSRPGGARRAAAAVADSLPVLLLAAIAGAGSFTHIRDTAAQHGQKGPMATAIAVCIDLTCVIAARRHGVAARRVSWPAIVLAAGVLLSLAANLAQAQPDAWGQVMAAVPAGAFLIAVSMLERRATLQHRHHSPPGAPDAPGRHRVPAAGVVPAGDGAADGQDGGDGGGDAVRERLAALPAPGRSPVSVPDGLAPLARAARLAAAEHIERHGQPITRDALRARLGVSNQAASDLLRQIRQDGERR